MFRMWLVYASQTTITTAIRMRHKRRRASISSTPMVRSLATALLTNPVSLVQAHMDRMNPVTKLTATSLPINETTTFHVARLRLVALLTYTLVAVVARSLRATDGVRFAARSARRAVASPHQDASLASVMVRSRP